MYLIKRDIEKEKEWLDNLFVLLSFPRSGSHWTRRMLAEIVKIKSGVDIEYGKKLNEYAGFKPPAINSDEYSKLKTPMFIATHSVDQYSADQIKVYLKRNKKDVIKSNLKSASELDSWYWGNDPVKLERQWKDHVEEGEKLADIVINYEDTKKDPHSTVRKICELAGLEVTDEEIELAVEAGKKENMLKEQEKNCPDRKWDCINK